ncbi:hypothetical protein LQ567_19230 [Niabella pedocola]|uniref:Uncharacterized protein n=1 Tax=Niabella pedocola TaxID=1752077 RepID=A0ABS8PV40_9BACT|nr:hypothetical protein [Niabella pedocola]MCD2424925.1 hypothetical protein [Niabella pedocola]
MLKHLLLIIITTMSISTTQAQTASPKYRLLVYGLPNFSRQNAEDVIAHKWGIEFYPVGDCTTPQEIADSAEKHNTAVKALIAKKYGRQWNKRFDEEVNAEFARQRQIIEWIESLDYVKKKKAEMEANEEIFFNLLTPIPHTYKYDVQIRGWEKHNDDDVFYRFYRFEVDYKNRRVKLVSDKKEKQDDKRYIDG